VGRNGVSAACLVVVILQVLQELPHLLDPALWGTWGRRRRRLLADAAEGFSLSSFDDQSQASPRGLQGVLEVCVAVLRY